MLLSLFLNKIKGIEVEKRNSIILLATPYPFPNLFFLHAKHLSKIPSFACLGLGNSSMRRNILQTCQHLPQVVCRLYYTNVNVPSQPSVKGIKIVKIIKQKNILTPPPPFSPASPFLLDSMRQGRRAIDK